MAMHVGPVEPCLESLQSRSASVASLVKFEGYTQMCGARRLLLGEVTGWA